MADNVAFVRQRFKPDFPSRRWATHTEVSTRTIPCALWSTARRRFQLLLSPAQPGKSPAALPRDESFKTKPDESQYCP